jgi:hypothetical protein
MRPSDVRSLVQIDDKRFDELYTFLFEPTTESQQQQSDVPVIKLEEDETEAEPGPSKANGMSTGGGVTQHNGMESDRSLF